MWDCKAGLGFCDKLPLSDRCFLGTYDEDDFREND